MSSVNYDRNNNDTRGNILQRNSQIYYYIHWRRKWGEHTQTWHHIISVMETHDKPTATSNSPSAPSRILQHKPQIRMYVCIYTNGLHKHTRISYVAVRQVDKSQQINGDIIRFPGISLHLGWIDGISCPMVEAKPVIKAEQNRGVNMRPIWKRNNQSCYRGQT